MIGLQIPATTKSPSRNKTTGEELLLVGLYRLHRPTSLSDACWKDTFGLDQQRVWYLVKNGIRER